MIYLDAAAFRQLLAPASMEKLRFLGQVELELASGTRSCTTALALLQVVQRAREGARADAIVALSSLVAGICDVVVPLDAEAVIEAGRELAEAGEPADPRALEWALARRAGATRILSPDRRWGALAGPDALC